MSDESRLPALSGLDPEGLFRALAPMQRFRSKQIFQWIARGVSEFGAMTDLPASVRLDLAGRFRVRSSAVLTRAGSVDGTLKLQIGLDDGAKIEAVLLIDGEGRRTACLSTQVGCPMACSFCKTGSLGFLRNLSASEMVDQFLHLQDAAGTISNIVVMGMGEPLLNLDALREAVSILSHPDGLGLSKRRFTVSTSGIVSGIRAMADAGPDIRLALSLTTADPALRRRLMPATRTDPLPELKSALLYFQSKHDKRLTLEAVLLGGLNTRVEDADAMAAFARGLDVIVNLIPWNPVDGLGLEGTDFIEPSESEVARFEHLLAERRIPATRRYEKGRGVEGACGQLGSTLASGDRRS